MKSILKRRLKALEIVKEKGNLFFEIHIFLKIMNFLKDKTRLVTRTKEFNIFVSLRD